MNRFEENYKLYSGRDTGCKGILLVKRFLEHLFLVVWFETSILRLGQLNEDGMVDVRLSSSCSVGNQFLPAGGTLFGVPDGHDKTFLTEDVTTDCCHDILSLCFD